MTDMAAKLLIAALMVLLVCAGWVSITGWNLESDAVISGHGYAAMIIGIVFSLAVGIALMTLVFYSNRMGYDEAASNPRSKEHPDHKA